MTNSYQNPRIDQPTQAGNAEHGRVVVDRPKLLWVVAMLMGTLGALWLATPGAIVAFLVFTATTLCLGHSLGMHRRLIHRSFECPRWLEYTLVHLGTLVGLAGPLGMLRTHDTRDWAQRQRRCHPYYSHRSRWHQDLFWQLCCRLELARPPEITVEPAIAQDPVYRWMERHWMAQQLPWAALLFVAGGLPWVLWGICARVTVSIVGHWLIGYFAHGEPGDHWTVRDAAVQGRNVSWTSLLTMGECWHNNHHAFPGSARLGLYAGQWDPGWSVLAGLHRAGLVWNIVLPAQLPERPELQAIRPFETGRGPAALGQQVQS